MDELDIFQAVRESQVESLISHNAQELQARLVQATGTADWNAVAENASIAPRLMNFLRREFPREATLYDTTINRRAFLKLAGAGLALAGLAACSPPRGEKIVPYVNQPERIIPGKSLYYTTAMTLGGYATGLLVRSEMGRPIKVEGNPLHPASLGATDIFAQASVLTLYDPDRSRIVLENGNAGTWEDFFQALRAMLDTQRASGGAGLRVLAPTLSSPALAAQVQTFLSQFPNAQWHSYEPFHRDNARAGAQLAFGQYVETQYDLSRTDVLVTLDSDFLNRGPGNVRYAHDFAARRHLESGQTTLNRLYAVESTPTLTGTQSDHRLALRASEIATFARALAGELGIAGVSATPPPSAPPNWLTALARDLQAHRGSSLVVAGDAQPPYVHAVAHALNDALGNVGATMFYTAPVAFNPTNQLESLRALASDMSAGKVQALLILGGNPAYDAPVDLDFAAHLKTIPFTAHLGMYADETSQACKWHLPEAHYLEAWGDTRAHDGSVSIVQPLIAPLFDSKSMSEVISAMLDPTPHAGHDLVKEFWQQQSDAKFETLWQTALSTGIVPDTAFPPLTLTLKTDWLNSPPPAPPLSSYEVVFCPDSTIADGTFANNAWLQELPKPFTKLTWDNVIAVSPATGRRLGLDISPDATGGEHGQVITDTAEVKYQGRTLQAPVWILPGQPDEMVTLFAGYGRTHAGNVGNNAGYNAYALRTSNALWFDGGLELKKLDARVALATTQFHANMEGRDLVQNTTLQTFLQNPTFAQKPTPDASLYPPPNQQGEQWGMAIDLNACIGCNACVIACQAENNIPSVGKAEVLRAREMHWIRIDRYYEGEGAELKTLHEPVPCMHCEYAPCEVVCPVAATTHSPDGLNEMTYNRCIGTRYCSNNCPYKVRRFNFFQYSDWSKEGVNPALQHNPDVTVRSRGVMEKCTYCVQRIQRARIGAQKENREIRDGEILTACQAVCPAQAITFGNLNDPNSQVAKWKANPRNYTLLAELNTRPRTSYLAIVRNPNPELT